MERLRSLVRRVTEVPLARHLILAVVAYLVVVAVIATSSQYLQTRYAEMAYFAIAAGGLTLLTGLSGQLSLGHGALMAVGAYAATLTLERTGGQTLADVFMALLVAIAVCAAVGVVVGVPAARLHGPYIAGATLTLAVAVPRLAHQWPVLGGEQGIQVPVPRAADLPVWLQDVVWFVTAVEIDQYSFLAYLGWLLLALTFVALANLSRSRVGRRWRAVRDDDVSAELAGIHLGRARVVAFTVSAMCAGLAGGLMAMNVRLTAPGAFTITLSLTLLAAVVLGGLGSLTGALIGAGVLAFLPQLAGDLGEAAGLSATRAAEVTPVVYGLVLMLVILLAPAGIVGSLRPWWARVTSRRGPSPLGSTKEKTP